MLLFVGSECGVKIKEVEGLTYDAYHDGRICKSNLSDLES